MKGQLAILLVSLTLSAQDRYVTWSKDKDADVCPRQEQAGSSPYQPSENFYWKRGVDFVQAGQRKDVSGFTVVGESGQPLQLKSLKGKPVIIGLWSTHCEPSLFLLSEMAQLSRRTASFGFEVLPTNFDRERWITIRPFLNQKSIQPLLQGVKIFTPEMGESGVYTLMPVVPVLPTFFIVDREGRLAVTGFGFKPGELAKWLKVILSEPALKAPAAPQPNPAPSPTPS